jgi:signal transduction histidine kinase
MQIGKRQMSLYGLAVLLLIAVPIVHLLLSVTFSYWILGRTIQPIIGSNLISSMELQRSRVEQFFEQQEHEADHVAKSFALHAAIDSLVYKGGSEENIRQVLANKSWTTKIDNARVLDLNGKVIFDLHGNGDDTRRIQSLIPRQRSAELFAIYENQSSSSSSLVHSLPMLTKTGFEGTLVVEKSLSHLDSLVLDGRDLHDTGEVVLVRRDERGELRFASQLRFSEQFPSKMPVPAAIAEVLGASKLPAGLISVPDYRGVTVLAMFSKLPLADLYLMVTIDRDQAMKPLTDLRTTSVCLSVGGILLAVFLAYLFSRAIKKPLEQIAEVASSIEGGDYKAVVYPSAIKEIDEVGKALNTMTSSLVRAIEDRSASIQELEYFTRYATHDLHEPTKKLRKGCEIIRSFAPEALPQEVTNIIENLEFSADSMNDIISGMRALSGLSKAPLVRSHVQVEEVLLSLLSMLAKFLESNKTQVVLTALPTVYVSERLLPYLYRNLTQTLVLLGDVGRRVITFAAEPIGDSWILGIKVTPRLFSEFGGADHFYSAADLKYKFHDHDRGMGLALCRKIVALHDGDIWVTDTDKNGTLLRMVLHFQSDGDRELLKSKLAEDCSSG